MVRPVEPDPPAALRRVDTRVKRTDATTGYPRVEEETQRRRGDQGLPVDADEVSIGCREAEVRREKESEPAPKTPAERIDVAG